MTDRVADVVSSITNSPLPDKVPVDQARAAGRFGHDKPTYSNSIVLLIDHQIGLMASTRDTTTAAELKSNVVGLARVAKALELPVLISSSNAQWQNGDTLPEIKELFPDVAIIRRTGIINAYEDPEFRAAFDKLAEETGRRHVIVAGVTIGTCATFPTLSLRNDGYQVFPVIDACGAWDRYEVDAALARMVQAGAEPTTTFALACELQEDWKNKYSNAMLEPFYQNLSEYGWVTQNFWNNVGGHVVPDPFGTVS
ncbi:MAG: isochorismatase family protein [Trebonia sp.]|jgi:nicotinamidase-related amidase